MFFFDLIETIKCYLLLCGRIKIYFITLNKIKITIYDLTAPKENKTKILTAN